MQNYKEKLPGISPIPTQYEEVGMQNDKDKLQDVSEPTTIVTLKKGEGRSLKAGGMWIFDNEIASILGTFKNGSLVKVKDFDGYPMGIGYINQNSKIRVRMLTRKQGQVPSRELIRKRLEEAWAYRKTVLRTETHIGEETVRRNLDGACECAEGLDEKPEIFEVKSDVLDAKFVESRIKDEDSVIRKGIGSLGMEYRNVSSCRLIFGEADFLPGIVVDKYSDVLVVQCLALGMEAFKAWIVEDLIAILKKDGIEIRGVYERSDANERVKEGLPKVKGFLTEEFDTNVEIVENGVHYLVDVVNGQKTGFFLDQKFNRLAMQRICKDKKVLDCFTHMGTFALNAGIAGAKEVLGLDISEYAVEQATANAVRNHLADRVTFRAANVLDELPRLKEQGESFDVVILDPPAFTKSREATKNAIKGYREINMKGLKLVRDGGYLATCSCSHFMTQELFTKTIQEAAKATHKRLRQIEFRTQSADHPILWMANESYYLKFYIFQVVEEI